MMPTTPATGGMLSRQEAARYLGISTQTLGRLTLAGSLRSARIGARRLYHRDWLDDFVRASECRTMNTEARDGERLQ